MAPLITTSDGQRVLIRRLAGEDGKLLGEFFASLSERTTYHFHPHPLDFENAARICAKAGVWAAAFIQTIAEGGSEKVVGYAYFHETADPALIGICIRDGCQGLGLGTHLMACLIEAAREAGLKKMALHVNKDNATAIRLYEKVGFVMAQEKSKREQSNVAYMVMDLG